MPETINLDPQTGDPLPAALLPKPYGDDSDISRVRLRCFQQYLTYRADGRPIEVTLANMVLDLEEDENAPSGIDLPVMTAWAAEEHWERAWQAVVGAGTLERTELRAEHRLNQALKDRQAAHDVYLKAYDVVVTKPSAAAIKGFKEAHTALMEAEHQVTEFEQTLYRRALQQAPHPEWKKRELTWLNRLKEHYGELGPQYDLLVYRLAAAETRCEQLEESGEVDGEEYARSVKTITDLTAQLQRYTEASKTQSIEARVNANVYEILDLIQRTVLHDQPQLMRQILDTIKAHASGEPLPPAHEEIEPERLSNGALRSQPIGPFA